MSSLSVAVGAGTRWLRPQARARYLPQLPRWHFLHTSTGVYGRADGIATLTSPSLVRMASKKTQSKETPTTGKSGLEISVKPTSEASVSTAESHTTTIACDNKKPGDVLSPEQIKELKKEKKKQKAAMRVVVKERQAARKAARKAIFDAIAETRRRERREARAAKRERNKTHREGRFPRRGIEQPAVDGTDSRQREDVNTLSTAAAALAGTHEWPVVKGPILGIKMEADGDAQSPKREVKEARKAEEATTGTPSRHQTRQTSQEGLKSPKYFSKKLNNFVKRLGG